MAKKVMTAEESEALIKAAGVQPAPASKGDKVLVKAFQMGLPSDLLGSKITFAASRSMDLEATPLGIIMRSKNSKRKMLISWANIKACEFYWDGE